MAENQETNSFIDAMKTEKPKESPKEKKVEISSTYAVNPNAESVANTVAIVGLWLFIIFGAGSIIGGIVYASEWGDLDVTSIILLLSGVILILIGIILWALMKMFVNMSRNLFNINDVLHIIKNK